ncbi:MAG TPA: hypothetical protein PLD25_21860 [Chloroflexota bacterium]|nr:hypothetical protein [Chloroflexota bacterium]
MGDRVIEKLPDYNFMRRLLLFFLVAATIFLTPVGVFVCGSLAQLPGDDPAFTTPCDNPSLLTMADTAVSSYLTAPFLANNLALLSPVVVVTAVATGCWFCPLPLKRKPPTPPPNACF